jgi:oligopeptide transport system substrate-binding protein
MERLILQPKRLLTLIVCLFLVACDGAPLNDPYPAEEAKANILYSAFSARPKYLDPARSYSSDESIFTAQIYEPPLQYAYQAGEYTLIPLTAVQMPKMSYLTENGELVDAEKYPEKVAQTRVEIEIQPGIFFQPHPAFAYHDKKLPDLSEVNTLNDFPIHGTRELLAEDYVYEIKRLAWPKINSPIFDLMSNRIIGLKAFHEKILNENVSAQTLRDLPLSGVEVVSPYIYRIHLNGIYRQFPYWLAMPFFAPIPWEADVFYANEALIKKNIVLDWYPVGTGPYMLDKNNPNSSMVMVRNPQYRDPPQIEKIVFTLEKENIPRWNKFLQGYYDASGIDSDSFNSAVQTVSGQSKITPLLKEKNIRLVTEVNLADFYWGFNMQDEVVGGISEKKQKIRQAIAIAMDVEEYIDIFLNGRAKPAHFILPPNIFGYQQHFNPYTHEEKDGQVRRKSINEAKKLLAEAGYPEGKNAQTGDPLIIHFDTTTDGSPDNSARDAWMRKQFKKIGIDLEVRATDYNRFREKLDNGNFQFFFFGWIADYPDPENFLFLLYGPNGKQLADGVNSTNYNNPEYNQLFEEMILLPDNQQRKELIKKMADIAQKDSPMVWGFNPESYTLNQAWLQNVITNQMVRNDLKYFKIDGAMRAQARELWNKPIFWPIAIVIGLLIIVILPLAFAYRHKEHHSQAKRFKL